MVPPVLEPDLRARDGVFLEEQLLRLAERQADGVRDLVLSLQPAQGSSPPAADVQDADGDAEGDLVREDVPGEEVDLAPMGLLEVAVVVSPVPGAGTAPSPRWGQRPDEYIIDGPSHAR